MSEDGTEDEDGEGAETPVNQGESAPADVPADRASTNDRAIAWNETPERVHRGHDPRTVAALAELLSRLAGLASGAPAPGVGTCGASADT